MLIPCCLGVLSSTTELGQRNTTENAGPQRSLIHLIPALTRLVFSPKRPKPALGCLKLPAQLRTDPQTTQKASSSFLTGRRLKSWKKNFQTRAKKTREIDSSLQGTLVIWRDFHRKWRPVKILWLKKMAKFVIFLAFSGLISVTHGDQIVLLDTTKESMLDWTRYPFGPDAPTPGWVEESFTKFEKNINWRSYVVCDVTYAKNNVNNWLWTPFITRNGANRIHIEIKFSLRNCDLFPGKVLQCKETFR